MGDLLFGVLAGDVGVEGAVGASGRVFGAGEEVGVEGWDAATRAGLPFGALGDLERALAVERNVKDGD